MINGNWINNVKEGNGYEVYENGESQAILNGFKHGKGFYKLNNHKFIKESGKMINEWKRCYN